MTSPTDTIAYAADAAIYCPPCAEQEYGPDISMWDVHDNEGNLVTPCFGGAEVDSPQGCDLCGELIDGFTVVCYCDYSDVDCYAEEHYDRADASNLNCPCSCHLASAAAGICPCPCHRGDPAGGEAVTNCACSHGCPLDAHCRECAAMPEPCTCHNADAINVTLPAPGDTRA